MKKYIKLWSQYFVNKNKRNSISKNKRDSGYWIRKILWIDSRKFRWAFLKLTY